MFIDLFPAVQRRRVSPFDPHHGPLCPNSRDFWYSRTQSQESSKGEGSSIIDYSLNETDHVFIMQIKMAGVSPEDVNVHFDTNTNNLKVQVNENGHIKGMVIKRSNLILKTIKPVLFRGVLTITADKAKEEDSEFNVKIPVEEKFEQSSIEPKEVES